MFARTNTGIEGMTVMDHLRGIVRVPVYAHSSTTSVSDGADDGYVTMHGANVDIANPQNTTVLEPRATMRDAAQDLCTFVETGAAARGVRYVIACQDDGIRIEMYLNPINANNNYMDMDIEP